MSHRKQIQVSTSTKGKGKGKRTVVPKSNEKECTKESKSSQKKARKRKQEIQENESDQECFDSDTLQDSPQPGPSGACADHMSEDDSEVDCVICNKSEKFIKGIKEFDWIQCDSCDGWIHRSCAGLKHHMKWKKATAEGADFFCKQCE